MTAAMSNQPSFPRKRESMLILGNSEMDSRLRGNDGSGAALFRAERQP